MATDTIPAAVPGPSDPPDSTPNSGARTGWLTSTLAPVDPVRPTFDLAPETVAAATPGEPQATAASGSSADHHGDDAAPQKADATGGKSVEKKGIWRAWLLAGAARWGKGGGSLNKRLDLAKAKAQASQVKTNRQVTINRSGGLLGGRAQTPNGAGGSGGKSLNSKGGPNGPGKGPRNSNGNAHGSTGNGSAGRSGSGGGSGSSGGGGRGPGGGASSGGSGNGSPKGASGAGVSGGGSPKSSKGDSSKGSTGGSSGAGKSRGGGEGKAGGQGSAGGAGKNGSGSTDGGKGSGPKDGPSLKKDTSGKAGKSSDGSPGKGADSKGGKGAPGKNDTPRADTGSSTSGKGDKPSSPSKDGKSGKPEQDKGSKKNQQPDGKPFSTKESREAGYRDGTRVARAVAHAKAYRDGAKDGWADITEAADREKARLDEAHTERKAKTQGADPAQAAAIEDDNEPMEDPFMSTATPIQAQGIDAKKITLGDSFLKPSVTRGELRRFKQYEVRLEARIDGLAKVADATKTLAAQAREQADECQKLAEAAKGVEGGEKLTGELQKLADQAKAQADEADEVHKGSTRSHDFAKAVLSNVQTRYAPLYQAVVDSDETKPAELKFYADRGVTRSDTALAA